jgi:hypothetical protein
MAASQGSLNARLTLLGSDQVERQFNDIATAGEKAGEKIHAAFQGSGEGLEGFEETAEGIKETFEGLSNLGTLGGIGNLFESVAGSIGHFNVVLGAGIAIITGATAGLFELAESGAKFASEIKDGATRVGVASKDYAALRFAFEQSAASAEDFEKAMAKILEASGEAQGGADNVDKAADKIVSAEDRAKAAAESTAEAWRKRGDTLKEISIKTASDLSEINLRYQRETDAARKLDGQKETDELKKATDERVEAVRLLNKRIAEETRLANKAYQDQQAEQQRQRMKQEAEDLKAYYKAIDDAASKALTGSNKAIAALGVTVKETAEKARDPAEVFRDIADKLAEIEDPATKSAKAIEIFGRRIGTKLVEALSEGRDALKKLEDEAQHLNIIPSDKELDIGKKFDDEIAKLGSVVAAASGRVGLVFAPLFGEVVDALATAIGHTIPELIAGAQKVAAVLKPIFDDIAQALLGNTDKIKSQFVYVLVRAVQLFVEAVRIAGSVIGDVLNGVLVVFNLVDEAVQAVFGGASLGGIAGFLLALRGVLGTVTLIDIALSTLITGPLALLATALAPIVTAMTAIAAVVGWPVILIAGLTALIATLLLAGDGWKNFKTGVELTARVLAALVLYLTQPLVDAFNAVATAGKSTWETIAYWAQYAVGIIGQAWDWLYSKIKAVADAIASVLGTSSQVTAASAEPWRVIDPTKNAEGGLQTGPGTGTSDSILSWLSKGEYVVKARAVKYWGVNVMHRINNMISPRGYAAGGHVDALGGAMNASATRGIGGSGMAAAAAVEGRVAVDLSHNGTTWYGLLAPARVAAAMDRYASSQQRVSLGRRPTAFGAGA